MADAQRLRLVRGMAEALADRGYVATPVAAVIERAGGTILISAEVDQVIVEKNRAVGVCMADGREFRAKKIVSGAGFTL